MTDMPGAIPSAYPDSTKSGGRSYKWIDTFFGVLITPRQTFRQILGENAESLQGFPAAAIAVTLVFALDGLRDTSADNLAAAWFNVPVSIMAGMIFWMALSGCVALTASCFNQPKAHVRASIVSLGWTFVPWLLLAPIGCYRHLLGSSLVLFCMIPIIWLFVLQILAITESYQLKGWQTLTLVFVVPFLLGIVQFMQLIMALTASFGMLL